MVLNAILKSFSNLFFNLAEMSWTSTKVTTFYRHFMLTFPPLITLSPLVCFGLVVLIKEKGTVKWVGYCKVRLSGDQKFANYWLISLDSAFSILRLHFYDSTVLSNQSLISQSQYRSRFKLCGVNNAAENNCDVNDAAENNSAASTMLRRITAMSMMQRRITLRRQQCCGK